MGRHVLLGSVQAEQVVQNTAAATSVLDAAQAVPANYLKVGMQFGFEVALNVDNGLGIAHNLTIGFGTTTVPLGFTSNVQSIPVGAGRQMVCNCKVVVRSIGAGGTVSRRLFILVAGAVGQVVATGTAALDTTAAFTPRISLTWDLADAALIARAEMGEMVFMG